MAHSRRHMLRDGERVHVRVKVVTAQISWPHAGLFAAATLCERLRCGLMLATKAGNCSWIQHSYACGAAADM